MFCLLYFCICNWIEQMKRLQRTQVTLVIFVFFKPPESKNGKKKITFFHKKCVFFFFFLVSGFRTKTWQVQFIWSGRRCLYSGQRKWVLIVVPSYFIYVVNWSLYVLFIHFIAHVLYLNPLIEYFAKGRTGLLN